MITIGGPKDAIIVTPRSVEPDAFELFDRLPQRCLAVGGFVEKKAPLVTIAAFAKAAKNRPAAHLDLIGGGPPLAECQRYVAKRQLGDKITLHGVAPHQKVKKLMANASFFLQHSVTASDGDAEGLPVAILEVMSLDWQWFRLNTAAFLKR